MTAKEIYWKTMKFNWLKLGLGLATIFIAAILLGMCMLLGMLFGQLGMLVMFLVWIAAVRVVHLFIQHYVGSVSYTHLHPVPKATPLVRDKAIAALCKVSFPLYRV